MKKFLSILLVIAMVASLVAMLIVPAAASEYETRAVTADDVKIETSVNGTIGTTNVFFNGVKPEIGYYGWSDQTWDKKANGDYVLITFEDQVLVSDMKIYAVGNYPFAKIKGYNAIGEEVLSKNFNPNEDKLVEISIVSSETDNPVDVKYLKIVNDYDGKILRIGEIEIQAHFHNYGETFTDPTEPTCSKPGTGKFTCPSCQETKIDKISDPLGNHNFSTEGTPESSATADTQGEVRYPCLTNGCDEYLVELTPITAHNCAKNVVAPDCKNGGYIEYTCDKTCGSSDCAYTYKTAERSPLGHEKASGDAGTLYSKATIISNEIRTYACQRSGCEESFQAEKAGTQIKNPETATMILSNKNIVSMEENIPKDGGSGGDKTQLFDRKKVMGGDFYNPSNAWYATRGSTLTVVFDKEYIIIDATLYAASNDNNVKIQYFNANDEEVGSATNLNLAMGTTVSSVKVRGAELQPVKKIVITTDAKWENGSGMKLVELELVAHACEYKSEDRQNAETVPAECKTTFDGTCHLCGIYAEDVVEYNHTFEKVEGTDDIKIYSDREGDVAVSCYQDGIGYHLCTICQAKVDVYTPATGNHDFENGTPEYNKGEEPDCGNSGAGRVICATPGCGAKSEDCEFPATGEHSQWNWKVIEGEEPDYTHTGFKGYFCGVCGYQDTTRENQVADVKKLDCVAQKDWSIRYTDFTSPRATFKISVKNIEAIKDEFDVKIFGVVQKGEVTKEVQVYGEGATGVVASDGTFSLVVKGGSYTDEYKFSVRVEIKCIADNSKVENVINSKNLTTAADGIVSAKDVASYFLAPNRVGDLDAAIKKFYETIVG